MALLTAAMSASTPGAMALGLSPNTSRTIASGTGTRRDLNPSVLEFPRAKASAIRSISLPASRAWRCAKGGAAHSGGVLKSRRTNTSCVQS